MYQIVQRIEQPRVTPTREMTLVLARCCRCGVERAITEQNMRRANREGRECPACREQDMHHITGQRPYRIWRGMVDRTTNPDSPSWAYYGGRGITLDPRWRSFTGFWADMREGYSDGLTLERIQVNAGYRKSNCRWATNAEQQANKRTTRFVLFQGRQMHLAEFCRATGVSRGAITPYLQKHPTGDVAILAYLKSAYPRGRKSRSLIS